MSRLVVISIEDKFRLVISVISGEMSVALAAQRSKVSEQSIGNWKRRLLEGGKQGLADGRRLGSNPQLQRLEAEIEDLKTALERPDAGREAGSRASTIGGQSSKVVPLGPLTNPARTRMVEPNPIGRVSLAVRTAFLPRMRQPSRSWGIGQSHSRRSSAGGSAHLPPPRRGTCHRSGA